MSPITQAARERLMNYLGECNTFIASSTAEQRSGLNQTVDTRYALRLIEELIMAVRGEQDSDRPF